MAIRVAVCLQLSFSRLNTSHHLCTVQSYRNCGTHPAPGFRRCAESEKQNGNIEKCWSRSIRKKSRTVRGGMQNTPAMAAWSEPCRSGTENNGQMPCQAVPAGWSARKKQHPDNVKPQHGELNPKNHASQHTAKNMCPAAGECTGLGAAQHSIQTVKHQGRQNSSALSPRLKQ